MPAPRLLTRRASLRANSFDPESGTFSAVVATSTPVERGGWDGSYQEVLSLDRKAVRLDFLASGRAPLLDAHQGYSTKGQIGVVTGARIESGQLVADVQLSRRDDVKPIADDIAAGVIRNVSIGYRIYASAVSGDDRRTITRTDWEPIEVSLVPIPADQNSQIRQKEITMPPEDEELLTRADEREDRELADHDDEPAAPTISARRRVQLFEMAARHGVPGNIVTRGIADGDTFQQVRASILNRLAEDAERTRISPRTGFADHNYESLDNPDGLSRAIEGAIYSRMTGKAPDGAAVELRGRTLIDMGAALLEARGERVSWRNRDRVASQILTRGMHTTSDFPTLLTSASGRVLLDAFRAAGSALRAISAQRDAADFRPITSVRLGEAPALQKVNEGGEVKYGSRAEAKESFRVETFARIFSLSRQAIINDDLGAFADISAAYGRAAAECEASELAALIATNSGLGPNMDDGNALYSAAHANYTTPGTALSVDSLDVGRKALRSIKGLDGKTPIGVTPKFLLVSPDRETKAEQLLASLAAAEVGEVNPFSGKLTLLVEPRFTGNAWRLFVDPGELAVIRRAYLNGNDGPIVEQRDGWTTLGVEFRAVLDFGCGVEEYRGTYMNAGA